MYAAGKTGGAGIGGGTYGYTGAIDINGGYVEASALSGAGIGGGYGGNGKAIKITITGGTVIARASGEGDGIGGGGGTMGYAGSITISGGKTVVIASSGRWDSKPLDATTIARNGGLIIEGNTGALYSSSVTLSDSIAIPAGMTVTVGSGQTLTIPRGVPLKVDGRIQIEGGRVSIEGKNDVTVLVKYDYNGAPTDGKRMPVIPSPPRAAQRSRSPPTKMARSPFKRTGSARPCPSSRQRGMAITRTARRKACLSRPGPTLPPNR